MPCSLSVPLQDLEQDIRFYFSLCTQESELYMLNIRERTGVLFKRFSTLSLLRLVWKAILGLLTLQILTAAVLLVIAALGKRRKHEVSFPHDPFEEVQVGENVLRLYAYGRDLYDAMLEAIDAAQDVAVYVIFDRFGNLVVPRAFKSSFAPPIHVLGYSAIRHPWHLLDPRRYALDHRKLLIVDGTTSFIGGYNIGSTYATEWRDTHLGLRGPVAAELAMSFIAFWNRFCPAHERITHRYHRSVDSRIVAGQNEAMRLSFPIRDLYIAAIDQAEQFIFLTTAYFVPDRMLLEALQAAARRGVDVRVLIPWVSNHVLADWVAHSYFTDCLQGGVLIFGYRYTMLHAKTCTIDGQWSTVGTCNLDRLSLVGNYEINVAVYSAAFARQMSALFAEDTAERFELTMEQWKSRPWFNKVSERILAPLRFLM